MQCPSADDFAALVARVADLELAVMELADDTDADDEEVEDFETKEFLEDFPDNGSSPSSIWTSSPFRKITLASLQASPTAATESMTPMQASVATNRWDMPNGANSGITTASLAQRSESRLIRPLTRQAQLGYGAFSPHRTKQSQVTPRASLNRAGPSGAPINPTSTRQRLGPSLKAIQQRLSGTSQTSATTNPPLEPSSDQPLPLKPSGTSGSAPIPQPQPVTPPQWLPSSQ